MSSALKGALTYSTTVWSSNDDVVFKLEILVKHVGVKLNFAVEAIADSVPIGSRFRHSYAEMPVKRIGAVRWTELHSLCESCRLARREIFGYLNLTSGSTVQSW